MAAKEAALNIGSEFPVIASMTFQPGICKTMMGVSTDEAVDKMLDMGVKIMGSNCGCGIKQMVKVIELMRKRLDELKRNDIFLIAQSNAGMPKLENDKTIFTETPEDFTKVLPELLNLKINIIGGCCGSTPEHIRQIAKIIKK